MTALDLRHVRSSTWIVLRITRENRIRFLTGESLVAHFREVRKFDDEYHSLVWYSSYSENGLELDHFTAYRARYFLRPRNGFCIFPATRRDAIIIIAIVVRTRWT